MTLAKYFRYQLKQLMLLSPLALCTVARIWAQAASTTTLTASPTTAAWPAAITLTATVQSGGISVLPGLVKFCNASASSCQGPALLGQAQLTSAGKASIRLTLGMGTHSIKAVFVGTKTIASSTSSAQTVTLTGQPASATTLSTAGTTPPYTLTAAVTGNARSALTGNVTFNDASNLNLALGTAALGTSKTNLSFGYNALSGTAPNPLAMAVGDFNGDGYPDIVLADSIPDASGSYALSVFLSTGPGTYGTPTTYTLPFDFINAAALAVGDFNNDGNLDLAVAGDNSNGVMILLGNGAGSFTQAGIASTGSTPNSIVVGDFNGDGNADVAVTNRGSASVSVFLGDGSGGLNPVAAMPPTGSFPYWVAIGDFNGDGKQDLAVANYFGFNVTVLLGNGDGTFTPTASSPSVGVYPAALTVADFNGDRKQDVAVVNQYSKTVTILLGDGKGDFTPTSTSPAIGNNVNSITTGDFNGDGVPDLAVASGSDNTISIFLGKGDGTFPTSQLVNLAAGTGPGSVNVGDFNGDGLEDVAVAGAASNTAVIVFNTTTTSATATVSGITVPGGGAHNVTASFAGNSNYSPSTSSFITVNGSIIPTSLSLAVEPKGTVGVGETIQLTVSITPGQLGALVPTGTVTFYNGTTVIGEVTGTGGVEVENYTLTAAGTLKLSAKYSGDGNFTGSTSGTTTVTVASPTASTTTLTVSSSSVAIGTPVALTASVTSGGRPVTQGAVQFVVCPPVNFACEFNSFLILGIVQLTSKGTATLKQTLPAGGHEIYADFLGTNDVQKSYGFQPVTVTGTLSSATTLTASGSVGRYALTANVQGTWPPLYGNVSIIDTSNKNLALAMGTAFPSGSNFTKSSVTSVGQLPVAIAVGDFNGDGKPDLAVANYSTNSVSILLNNGNGTFTTDASAIPSTVKLDEPVSIAVGDFNGDGNLDLAVENQNSSTLTILLGAGNGSFTLKSTFSTPTMPYQVVTADFNGDGKLDLATAGFSDGVVDIYLGNGDGTFTLEPETPTFSSGGLIGVATADFNGDGKADLAVAELYSGTIVFLLGNGDGTFVADPVSTHSTAAFLAVADFNGDGSPDLAVTDASSFVTILLNQRDGNFNVLSPTAVGSEPIGVVAGDFNGDGIADLAVANDSSASVSILLGQNNGTFLPPITIPLASNSEPWAIASADFRGDGSPDLAVSDYQNGDIVTLLDSAGSSVSVSGFAVPGAGTHEIEAVYAGMAPYTGSTSSAVALAATQIPTTVTIAASPSSIVTPNSTVTLNVALSPTAIDNYTLTGTVSLYSGTTLLGQAALSNGLASFGTSVTVAGTYSFTVKYSGNTQFAASQSTYVVWVVPASTVTLTDSASSVASGTPVTLTAKVTSRGNPVTKGVVTFCNASVTVCDNSAVLGTANLTSNGSASLTLTLGIGAHSIRGIFAPTISEAGATSNTETITVTGKYGTTTTLADSVVSGTYTLTAKVLANGAHPATGNVSFVDSTSSTTLGTATLAAGSSALSFAAEASLGTGKSPAHVATGDFNRDGKLDVAVVNYISGTVTILLGNGNGTFTAKSTPTVGNNPQGITAGDFNGDGIPDLAVANLGGTVTILLGNGDGTFTTKSSPAVGTEPIAVATGDFNADGKLDLVVADESLSNVWILLGNGDGTFTKPSPFTAGSFPVSVAVADFNGDSRLDLAVVGNGGESVSILLGNGDGTFTAAPTLPDLGEPLQVVAADFNDDGKPDLAVANVNGTLSIFLNKGDGTFSAPTSVTVGINSQTAAVVVGDFNQDGKADLAVTSFQLGEAFILLGKGNGTFTLQSTPLKTGTGPVSVAAGDFNGDGLPDLAVANYGSNNLSVFVNSLKTSATATLSDVTITGSGNQSVQAKYQGAASFDASNSNALSLPPN